MFIYADTLTLIEVKMILPAVVAITLVSKVEPYLIFKRFYRNLNV